MDWQTVRIYLKGVVHKKLVNWKSMCSPTMLLAAIMLECHRKTQEKTNLHIRRKCGKALPCFHVHQRHAKG